MLLKDGGHWRSMLAICLFYWSHSSRIITELDDEAGEKKVELSEVYQLFKFAWRKNNCTG